MQKIFSVKHHLSIFRLWIFDPNGPFKSAVTTKKWAQKRCLPSVSDFLTMIFGFLTLKNMPGCIYSPKG